jgi:hypothetical protein
MSPIENFLDGGDKVDFLRIEVSKRVGDVGDGGARVSCCAEEIRGSVLSSEETFVNGGEVLKE